MKLRHRFWLALALAGASLAMASDGAAQQLAPEPLRRAREMFAANRHEEARAALAPWLQQRPDSAEANLLMGRIELQLGNLDAADAALLRTEGLTGRGRLLVPQTRGLVRLRRRDWRGAIESFDEALKLAPDYAGGLMGRARARASMGQVRQALADLAVVTGSPGPQPAARLLAGELKLALGDLRGAVTELQIAAEADGDSAASQNAIFYLATAAETPQLTLARVLEALPRMPDRAAPWFWLAVVRLSLADRSGARDALAVALAVNETHAASLVALARTAESGAAAPSFADVVGEPVPDIERQLGRWQTAIEEGDIAGASAGLRGMVAARPRFVPAHLLLVEIARRRGEPLGMLQALAGLAAAAPDLHVAHSERAVVAREVGAFALAEREARAALELVPGHGATRYLLATVLAATGRSAEAATECEAALAAGYDDAGVHVTLGNLYHDLQRLPEAVAELERAVRMKPATAENIAAFALTAMTSVDTARVVALLETAREQRPDGPNVLYALGSLYQRSGELERAAALFEQLLQIAPGRSEIHYNLAFAYRRLGRESDAAAQTALFEELKEREQAAWEVANHTYRRRGEAVAALESGDAARAAELLLGVVGAPGSEPDDVLLLAGAQLATGEATAAAASFARFLDLAPHDTRALCGAAAAADELSASANADAIRQRVAVLGGRCPGPSE